MRAHAYHTDRSLSPSYPFFSVRSPWPLTRSMALYGIGLPQSIDPSQSRSTNSLRHRTVNLSIWFAGGIVPLLSSLANHAPNEPTSAGQRPSGPRRHRSVSVLVIAEKWPTRVRCRSTDAWPTEVSDRTIVDQLTDASPGQRPGAGHRCTLSAARRGWQSTGRR